MDVAERFWAKVDKSGECWEWSGSNVRGYGRFRLGDTVFCSHRYSYIIHHPLTIDLLEHGEICVLHKCDNPKCVNPAHLFLGSHGDNMKDKMTKGRCWNGGGKQGEKHPCSSLTETQVREIRGRWATGGIKQKQLAVEYGVNYRTINEVVNRKSWKHLE